MSTSPTTVTRSSTTDSMDASPADVGDVGALLVERLRAWKHAVAYLEAYISQTESLHKHLTKEYGKVLKTVDEPLREGHHFNQSVGGFAAFFENLRANTSRISQAHTEAATELKSSVMPILERLHKEIKDRQHHIAKECERGAKAVQKSRNHTQQHIELLGQHSAAFDSVGGVSPVHHGGHLKLHHTNTGGKIKPEYDPYLLKKGIVSRLAKQIDDENAQRQDLIGVQNHSQQFEAHIVATIQQAIQALNGALHAQQEAQRNAYGDIVAKVNAIPPDFEFVNFLTRNAETLIDPNAPKRTVDAIRYPNEDHSSTKPLMEGPLSRKGKIMRSYNSAYYVVTPSKYLHEFKDLNSLNQEVEPEMSLYLPDCTISAINQEGKFQITGKDAGSSLKGLSTKHDYAFKPTDPASGQKWYEAISKCIGTKSGDSPITPTTATATTPPAIAEKAGGPPAYTQAANGQESGTTNVAVGGAPPAQVAEKAA